MRLQVRQLGARTRILRRLVGEQQQLAAPAAGAAPELLAPAEPVEVALEAPVRDPLKRPMNALSLECRGVHHLSSRLRRTRGACPERAGVGAPPVGGHRRAAGSSSARRAPPRPVLGAVGQLAEAVAGLADAAQHARTDPPSPARRRRGQSVGGPPQAEPAAGVVARHRLREVRAVHLEGLPRAPAAGGAPSPRRRASS